MSNQLQTFFDNYFEVKSQAKWSYGSFHAMTALTYTLKHKTFDKEGFKAVKKTFNKEVGWSSTLNAYNDDFLFVLLALKNERGSQAIVELVEQYKRLKVVQKFPVAQAYYCLYLLATKTEAQVQKILAESKLTHDMLKQRHPFLNNANDLPFITQLCQLSNTDATQRVSRIEEIYNHLIKLGLSQSNGLLSACVNLSSMVINTNEVGERVLFLKDQFKQLKLPFKAEMYELIPLVLIKDKVEPIDLDHIKIAYEEINHMRSVKWLSKKEKMLIAISIVLSDSKQLNPYEQTSDELFSLIERHQIVHYLKVTQMNNAAATATM